MRRGEERGGEERRGEGRGGEERGGEGRRGEGRGGEGRGGEGRGGEGRGGERRGEERGGEGRGGERKGKGRREFTSDEDRGRLGSEATCKVYMYMYLGTDNHFTCTICTCIYTVYVHVPGLAWEHYRRTAATLRTQTSTLAEMPSPAAL